MDVFNLVGLGRSDRRDFYGMFIMLTKLSILTFYLKFVLAGTPLRITIYFTMAVVVVYSVIASFVWVWACQPLEKYWDLTITEGTCVNFEKITVFSGVMNFLSIRAELI
jgi:hypothetical protein